MLKAEILSRLWMSTYGYHDYTPNPNAWETFEKFLLEWCSEKFSTFTHPGINVSEKEAENSEEKFVAGMLFSNFQFKTFEININSF